MKFTGIKTSFKGGMVSRRLVGRQKEGELVSSVEKMENYIIDRVGGAVRRGGLDCPVVQPFINSGDFVASYDTYPKVSSVACKYFAVKLRGREFVFRFDTTKPFNGIKTTANPTSSADFQSTFLNVIEPSLSQSNGYYPKVRVYAPYYTGTLGAGNMELMTNFNFAQGAPLVSTYLQDYLNTQYPVPVQMIKVTDSTVVFSCSSGISFSVTLASVPATTYTSSSSEHFLVLPYFVSVKSLFSLVGISAVSASYKIPIRPTTFPFNVLNSNTSYTINTAVVAGQSGGATADNVLSNAGNILVYTIDVPKDICLNASTGVPGNSQALEGKFLLLPLAATPANDVCFFICKYYSEPVVGTYRYIGIKITGGAPTAATSQWRLSAFGGETHPKAINYGFERLMYGNAGLETSKWWAAAIHPSSLTDFQSFMGFCLGQDATSDVSGMQYEGITQPKINDANYVPANDVNRYGFSSVVPNLAAINFISSRRKIHFGTIDGETQAELVGDSFAKLSYSQISVRTNSASYGRIALGDGKFFYLSNDGKDIRSISTEDKFYESQDELISTALEGIGLIFTKIVWFEKLNSVIALTSTSRVFLISVHADTQIKAVSEFVSVLPVLDIMATQTSLYMTVSSGGYQHLVKYRHDIVNAGDFSVTSTGLEHVPANSNLNAMCLSSSFNVLWNGTLYTATVNASGVATFPFSEALITALLPAYCYVNKVTAKIKSLPIDEGVQGGTAVGDAHRIDQLELMVDNSGPFKAGTEGGSLYTVEGLSLATMSTKYVKFDFPQTSADENHFYLETDNPTPVNISGVAYRGKSDSGV